jgi:hypothetical protein
MTSLLYLYRNLCLLFLFLIITKVLVVHTSQIYGKTGYGCNFPGTNVNNDDCVIKN